MNLMSVRAAVMVACLGVLVEGCGHHETGNVAKAVLKDSSVIVRAKDPVSDSSYERFMDSILVRKDIVYEDTAIEAEEVRVWSDEDGMSIKEPKRFRFGTTEFSIPDMDIVNEDGDRLYGVPYWVDTAYIFWFKGKKYGWAEAGFENCNGSGCLEQYYLLGDFQHKRLHVFKTMAVPSYRDYYGDMNGDGQLDFLIPDYAYKEHTHLPYSDTTETLLLKAYTLDMKGNFVAKRQGKGDCQLIGQFDHGNFAPANFRIIGSTCLFGMYPR